MKKLVALLACTVIATSAFAQGTVNFTNLKPTKQILTDSAGAKLEGAWAQLYAGKAADNLSAVGSPVALYDAKKQVTSVVVLLTLGLTVPVSFRLRLGRVLTHSKQLLPLTAQKSVCLT